jgi:hypothetical protein
MKWFGASWGAAVCMKADHVKTPVGVPCGHCGEPITAADQGAYLKETESWDFECDPSSHRDCAEPLHFACAMRVTVGSIGHQQRKCGCFNGTEGDPPNLTKRDAAEVTLAEFKRQTVDVN